MKIYILMQIDWECTDIVGVFYNKEEAEKLKTRLDEGQKKWDKTSQFIHRIEEHEVK